MAARQRIALLINSLNYGGAETQVVVLANGLARLGYSVSLLVFYAGGPLRERVSPEVRVRCLGRRGKWDVVRVLRNLFTVLDGERPDLLYAFMPGPNILASLAGTRRRKLKLAWGVRASDMDLRHYPWVTWLPYLVERRVSHWPDLIISNSAAGRRHAVARGFPDNERFIVIPNGIDVERFRPNRALGEDVRAEWGVGPSETLVGIVARLDPMKDYPNFLDAAAKLTRADRGMRFVSVGTGAGKYAAGLRERARGAGLDGRLTWAGPRGDLPAVYNAFDLVVSSSFTEGFSNAIAEAMACGIPCVATDVGDARELLGNEGAVVPRRDPEALAAAMMEVLGRARCEGDELRVRLRQRVQEKFSAESLVSRTATALEMIS